MSWVSCRSSWQDTVGRWDEAVFGRGGQAVGPESKEELSKYDFNAKYCRGFARELVTAVQNILEGSSAPAICWKQGLNFCSLIIEPSGKECHYPPNYTPVSYAKRAEAHLLEENSSCTNLAKTEWEDKENETCLLDRHLRETTDDRSFSRAKAESASGLCP